MICRSINHFFKKTQSGPFLLLWSLVSGSCCSVSFLSSSRCDAWCCLLAVIFIPRFSCSVFIEEKGWSCHQKRFMLRNSRPHWNLPRILELLDLSMLQASSFHSFLFQSFFRSMSVYSFNLICQNHQLHFKNPSFQHPFHHALHYNRVIILNHLSSFRFQTRHTYLRHLILFWRR